MILTAAQEPARFTVLASCSDKLAVDSCLLLCPLNWGRLQNLWIMWRRCPTFSLYCVTITRQQIFKGLLQVMVICILLHVIHWLLNADTLANNATKQWLLSSKPHSFIQCENREWKHCCANEA